MGWGFRTGTFLINNEAAKSDFWSEVRMPPWLHVDAVLVIITCNCQLLFGNTTLSGNPYLSVCTVL